MKKILLSAAVAVLFMFQTCAAQVATEAPAKTKEPAGQQTPQQGEAEKTETAAKAPVPTPVAFKANIAKLAPENTSIGFVGRHVTKDNAEDPNQRLGGFKKFTGEIHLNDDGKTLKAMVMEFDTTSVYTPIDNLTKHLKNADFLNVEKFPTAKFESTEIKAGTEEGQYEITGDFTLLGKTKPITMPCTVKMGEDGILVDTEFNLDRTNFGMGKMTERVASMVSIKVNVGLKTSAPAAGGRQQGRRGGSMKERFNTMDANGDGKLAGDEIPERMQQFMDNIDGNSDGELTLEEIQEGFSKMRQNRGGRRN